MNSTTAKRWLLAAVLAVATPALGEELAVRYATVNLQSGKTSTSARVAQLKQGDKVEVLAREGTWLKVKAGDKVGYLQQNSVGIPGASRSTIGKTVGGSSAASAGTSGEAAKGVGESNAWAKSTGRNTAGLERMLALRNEVDDAQFEKFTTEGNVGPAKK
jgi:hypothetical protein